MDWIQMINKVLALIEADIGNSTLCPEILAKQVHVSEAHFIRAFHVLTGFTLSEYIRNRRLCVAGEHLQAGVSVLETAYSVGYESPEAFSKAFKRYHGVNPSESKGAQLKEFYPLQLKLILIQEKPLAFKVMQKKEIYLCGTTDSVSTDDSNATSNLWVQCEAKGYLDRCVQFPHYETLVGVSTAEGYTIKAKCTRPLDGDTLTIPALKWVVFDCTGHGAKEIMQTWDQIYTSWIPKTEYEIIDQPQLEVYRETEDGYGCEIWIAVK